MVDYFASGFDVAFSTGLFFSVRGCENVHIYFWTAKDLCWLLNQKIGIFFGLCAILWLGVLLYHAVKYKNNEEIYFVCVVCVWLMGNFIWMTGNLLYGTDIYKYPAQCLMMIGLIMVVLYFTWFKRLDYFKPNEKAKLAYSEAGLICRFENIDSWRRYEFVHVFFWLLKDYSWCSQDQLLWIVAAIPTLFMAIDFIIVSSKNPKMMIDKSHYWAQLFWILSNLTWALTELFNIGPDNSHSLSRLHKHPNGRTIATIILILAYLPIIFLYLLWIPLTLFNKINNNSSTLSQKLSISTPLTQLP